MCKPIKVLLMPLTCTFQIITRTFTYAILAIEDIIRTAIDSIHDLLVSCVHFLHWCIVILYRCCRCTRRGCNPGLSYTSGFCFMFTTTILVLLLIYIHTDWIKHLLAIAGVKLSIILFYVYDALSSKMSTEIPRFSDLTPAAVDNTIPKMDDSNHRVNITLRTYNLPTNDVIHYQNILFDESESYVSKSQSTLPYFSPYFNRTSTFTMLINEDNIVVNSQSYRKLFKLNSYLDFYTTQGHTILNSYNVNMKRFKEKNVTEKVLLTQIPHSTNNKEKLTDMQWEKNEFITKNSNIDTKREENFETDLYKNYNYTRVSTVTNFFKNIGLVEEKVTGKHLLTIISNFTNEENIIKLAMKSENKDYDTTKNINIDNVLLFDDGQKSEN